MEQVKQFLSDLKLKLGIFGEFLSTLWKYKLWWSFPIIMVLSIVMLILLAAGHTGVAAIIYPLF